MPIDFIHKAIKEARKKTACDKIDKSDIESISEKGYLPEVKSLIERIPKR